MMMNSEDIKDVLMADINQQKNKIQDHIETISDIIKDLQSLQNDLTKEQMKLDHEFISQCTPLIENIHALEHKQGMCLLSLLLLISSIEHMRTQVSELIQNANTLYSDL